MQQPSDHLIEPVDTHPPVLRDAVQRWRLVLAREAAGGDGQRAQQASWEASLVASGLPVAGLDAPKPKPRYQPAAPLSGSISGEAELVDLWLVERLPVWRVREALAGSMPSGYRLLDLHDVWLGEASLPGRVVASVYRARVAAPTDELWPVCERLLAASTLPRERRKGEHLVGYDLRPFIDDLTVLGASDGASIVRMTLRHDPEKGVGRPEEMLAALAHGLGREVIASALVREALVLADPVAPSPPPRRGPQRPKR